MRYNLTCTVSFYGVNESKTYYDVAPLDVYKHARFMCENFNVQRIFIYAKDNKIGRNTYIATYNYRYDNFRLPSGQLVKTLNL